MKQQKKLNAYPSGKLPSVQTLRAEYKKLSQEKDRLYQQYGERKKQDKQLDTIRQNIVIESESHSWYNNLVTDPIYCVWSGAT